MTGELPFFVERRDSEEGRITYDVWQRDASVKKRNKQGKIVTVVEELHIASFSERDFNDPKQMAERVALGLNITSDIKGMA